MNLSDAELLEMDALCGAVADECLNPAQQLQLNKYLKTSSEAREIYFRSVAQSVSLTDYANEMQSEAPAAPVPRSGFRAWRLAAGIVTAMAACVALGLFIFPSRTAPVPATEEIAESEMLSGTLVARITGGKNCVWNGMDKFSPGDSVRGGQRLDLAEGLAEVTFDSGAQVMLEAPVVLDVVSAWEATLQRGGLKATVPPQAIGFRVRHHSVEVVDLGTEFSMVADATGEAEVRVLKGAVEVSPVSEEEAAPSVLRENETRRFGTSGGGRSGDFEARHRRLAASAKIEHWNQRVNFAHWSFDEVKNGVFKAETAGLEGTFDAQPGGVSLADGLWRKASHFDGHSALTMAVPGISKASSRAIAFWVRVPEDAQLSDSRAMVAWPMRSKKYGNRFMEIGWNRNPNQGPLGALRTELGKAYAVGATSLRDGRWHHIAVVLLPIGSADGPVQVTQYLDGRLEGVNARVLKMKHASLDPAAADVVWLGRAPGKHNKDKGHFRGDIDELFITDRALSEPEIVRVMTQNTLPRVEITAADTDAPDFPPTR